MNKIYKKLFTYKWYKKYILHTILNHLITHKGWNSTAGLCAAWTDARHQSIFIPNCSLNLIMWDLAELHVAITKHPLFNNENYKEDRGWWFHDNSNWLTHEYNERFSQVRIDVIVTALRLLDDPTYLDKPKLRLDTREAVIPKIPLKTND